MYTLAMNIWPHDIYAGIIALYIIRISFFSAHAIHKHLSETNKYKISSDRVDSYILSIFY